MENPKYKKAKEELESTGITSMRVFGNSMTPIIKSGSLLTFEQSDEYHINDIVFCKVRGRIIDAHKISSKNRTRYLISNNHGYDNGWTSTIYGRVVAIEGIPYRKNKP